MSKAARERSARERLAAERKKQAARDKQRKLLGIVLGSVVAVALVVVIAVVAVNEFTKRDQTAEAYTGALAPVSRQADGSIVMAKKGVTKPVLEVYEDFQCPACKNFEEKTGKTIKELAADGAVKVVFRPFQLFQGAQREPLSSNSERAANAALCVPAEQWVSYHDALFEFQPREGDKGFATDDLVAWGKDVGVTDAKFEKCVRDMQKKSQVAAMTKYATEKAKVESTPWVTLDGRKLEAEIQSPDALRAAVKAAAAAGAKG